MVVQHEVLFILVCYHLSLSYVYTCSTNLLFCNSAQIQVNLNSFCKSTSMRYVVECASLLQQENLYFSSPPLNSSGKRCFHKLKAIKLLKNMFVSQNITFHFRCINKDFSLTAIKCSFFKVTNLLSLWNFSCILPKI